jgi:CDGSH-type Zn-finger protein
VPSAPDHAGEHDHRRVWIEPGGPILVDGPVDLMLPDGTTVRCDRFKVAICTCRRSKRYPLCDTSHRRKVRSDQSRADGPETSQRAP